MLDKNQYTLLKQCLALSADQAEVIERFKKLTNTQITPSFMNQVCRKYDNCKPSELMHINDLSEQICIHLMILSDLSINQLKSTYISPNIDCIIIPSFHIDETHILRLYNFIKALRVKTTVPIVFNLHFDSTTYKLYGHLYTQNKVAMMTKEFTNITYHGIELGHIIVKEVLVSFSSREMDLPQKIKTDVYIRQTKEHFLKIKNYVDITIEKNSYSILTIRKYLKKGVTDRIEYMNDYCRLFK